MNAELNSKTNEKRLLRSMTEVDDQYVLDASLYGDHNREHIPERKITPVSFRKWAGYALAAAACIALVFVGTQMTNLLSPSEPEVGTGYDVSSQPYEEVASLDEAIEKTGFDLSIPEGEEPYDHIIFAITDDSMIEASYYNEQETDLGYYVRKAEGNDDISGDYEEYADTLTTTISGREVTLRGNGEMWSVAIWTSDDYTYAVGVQNHPMTVDQLTKIITAVE